MMIAQFGLTHVQDSSDLIDPYETATTAVQTATDAAGNAIDQAAPGARSWLSQGWKIVTGSVLAAGIFGFVLGRVSK